MRSDATKSKYVLRTYKINLDPPHKIDFRNIILNIKYYTSMTLITKIYDTSDFDEFILDHPYPAFETIQNRLSFRLDLLYNKANHVFCEKIYNNFNDQAIVYSTMELIQDLGNMQSVIACLDIIQFYSSFENYDVAERFVVLNREYISRG